jgi:hypothetical protein
MELILSSSLLFIAVVSIVLSIQRRHEKEALAKLEDVAKQLQSFNGGRAVYWDKYNGWEYEKELLFEEVDVIPQLRMATVKAVFNSCGRGKIPKAAFEVDPVKDGE